MKSILNFSLAMSLLVTGSAFAIPQSHSSQSQIVIAQDGAEHSRERNMRMAKGNGEKMARIQGAGDSNLIYVAEVRKEFGSQYQRY